MKKLAFTLILLLMSVFMLAKDKNKDFLVTYQHARVFFKASAYSRIIYRVPFGDKVRVLGASEKWIHVKVLSRNVKGYIHQDALIDKKTFKRQKENLSKRKSLKSRKASKFSEDNEVTAGAKGFSERDEMAAGTKGLTKKDDIIIGTKRFKRKYSSSSSTAKSFTKDIERRYKKKNRGMRFDLVDRIERRGEKYNASGLHRKWRKKGHVGEFSPDFEDN